MKNILVIAILITSLGTVFFFPLTFDGRYTCFFHRIFDHSHPVSNIIEGEEVHIHSEEMSQSDNRNSALDDRSSSRGAKNKIDRTTQGSGLLDKYLEQYAFVWWLSVGFLALCIFMWLNLNKKVKNKQSEIVTQ